jgi:hypothetical protein
MVPVAVLMQGGKVVTLVVLHIPALVIVRAHILHLKVGVVVISQALGLVIIPVMEWDQESLVGWAILKNRVTPTMLVNLLDRMFLIRTTK